MKLPSSITLPIWLLWLIISVVSLGGYIAAFTVVTDSLLRSALLTAMAVLCAGWAYLWVRTFRFLARLRAFFRRILADDYRVGVRDVGWIRDGLTVQMELANRTADRIRTYDKLRAERTGLSYRAMDMLFRNSEQALILADMGKKQFRFNPAIQQQYDVKQEIYSFESIERQKANTRFFRLFLIATLKQTVSQQGTAQLKLPQRETLYIIDYRLEPLKDSSEKVRFAVIFVNDFHCGDMTDTQQEEGAMSTKEAYVRKMQAQLDLWAAELNKLKAKAGAKEADAKLEIEKNSRELESKINEARQQMEQLSKAGGEAWESMREGVENAWGSLKKGFTEAAAKFDL